MTERQKENLIDWVLSPSRALRDGVDALDGLRVRRRQRGLISTPARTRQTYRGFAA